MMSLRAPNDAARAAVAPRAGRWEGGACLAVATLVGFFYLWSAMQGGERAPLSSGSPRGYYSLETAGFRSGHLYAALQPKPELLALRDPYDPAANMAYRVHDLSLYGGHYYLYFGVAPLLLLFWPYSALTGQYLSEPFAVGLFCSGAVGVGMALLLAIRRRHFPEAPFVVLLLAWLCLAWATPLILLCENPRVYEVPISCAVLLQALMLGAVYRALHSSARAHAWIGAASLLFGLSVAARPNFVANAVVLLVPVFLSAIPGSETRRKGTRLRALAWAVLPAAACGLGLLWYNWARFGSPMEFGIHYQLAAERVRELKAMSIGHLLPHLGLYLFNAGHWDSYFPFFLAPSGQPYGFLRYLPWAWLMLAAFLGPSAGEPGERRGRAAFIAALALAFASTLVLLSSFFGTTYRYPADFANAGMLIAGIGALSLGQKAARSRSPGLLKAVLSGIAAFSLYIGLSAYLGSFPVANRFLSLARLANWPDYAWQRSRGENFGGLRLTLKLPAHPASASEPLIETGRSADESDRLAVSYLGTDSARLIFVHAGSRALASREFHVPKDGSLVVEARFGSLLPPFGHPVFEGWSDAGFEITRRNLRLTVNGQDVLRAPVDCYGASPASTRVGRAEWPQANVARDFSGTLVAIARLPLIRTPRPAPEATDNDPVEFSLLLPVSDRAGADPLLLTGEGRESDLLYCTYDASNHIRFALDHYGAGGPRTDEVPYDPLLPHTLTVWMGSMARRPTLNSGAANPGRLVVVMDGRPLLNLHQDFFPASPTGILVGSNAFGSSAAGREFTGEIVAVRRQAAADLPPFPWKGAYGSVALDVLLPKGRSGSQEPLVVTGATGAGDFVYLRYVDERHIAAGFDHWGVGGLSGNVLAADYSRPHRIEVSFQSLYPEASRAHASEQVRVTLDGREALSGKFACYPSTAESIDVGANLIGGSTCGPWFTGNILSLERFSGPSE